MKRVTVRLPRLEIRLGRITIAPSFTWLLVIPVGLWLTVTLYLPILGGTLSQGELWVATLLIVLAAGVSLVAHVLGHVYGSGPGGGSLPPVVAIFLFGDAAQAWPVAGPPRSEAFASMAAPVVNLALGFLAYAVWDAQLNALLNTVTLFASAFNLWLFAINLTPAFPLDGGRLVKAIGLELGATTSGVTRAVLRIGWLMAGGVTCWGIYLILQHSRFSWATGGATLAYVLLVIAGLLVSPALAGQEPARSLGGKQRRLLETVVGGLVIAFQLVAALGLLLTNDGLEAPGAALSVEPMVQIPAERLHPSRGTFILTSVVVQTPITAGEWVVAKLSPVVKIVPPESIVPEDTTPQEQAREGYQMLDESETTAIVVGLRLAGYEADLVGRGVEVVEIQPESRAVGILRTGDVIRELNGNEIRLPSELVAEVQAQTGNSPVHLVLERDQRQVEVDVPLIPASEPGGSPKIGIVIQVAGFDLDLPFPVEIVPEKIVGGPSAGLMFTLTVYDLLSPEDLTGGRKIAGTGTISLDGSVGPIGGVELKVAAAEAAGATYFLCPVDNYADASAVAGGIQVVQIASVDEALVFLQGLPSE